MENRAISVQPMDNRSDVIKTFTHAVVSECSKPEGGHIRMFMPPDSEFMNILINAADTASVTVRIDHLIQLHQSESAVAASVENFHMILDTLPLISDVFYRQLRVLAVGRSLRRTGRPSSHDLSVHGLAVRPDAEALPQTV